MDSVTEKEHKFEVEEGFALPDFDFLVRKDSISIVHRPPVTLEAVYYDTDDLRLIRANVTLRRRTEGDDAGWHLKLPRSEPDERLEIHRRLGSESEASVPPELSDLVFAYSRGMAIRPTARVKTIRTIDSAVTRDGTSLIDVADDRVESFRLGASALKHWHEIEVEEQPGGQVLAKKIDALLRERGARPSTVPKFARALDGSDTTVHLTTKLSRKKSRGDLLSQRLAELTLSLIAHDVEFRRDIPDSLHEIRVATRRIRSCLRTFSPVIESEESAHLLRELGWLSDVLGAARDIEVLCARVDERVDEIWPNDLSECVRAHLKDHFEEARCAVDGEVRRAIGSARYAEVLNGLESFSSALASRVPKRKRRPARLRRYVNKEIVRTNRSITVGIGAKRAERDSALHAARKGAKRARYGAEVLVPSYGKRAVATAKAFEKIQEVLGGRHDAVMVRELMKALALRSDAGESETSFGYGVIAGIESQRIARIDEALGKIRRETTRKSPGRWLEN